MQNYTKKNPSKKFTFLKYSVVINELIRDLEKNGL